METLVPNASKVSAIRPRASSTFSSCRERTVSLVEMGQASLSVWPSRKPKRRASALTDDNLAVAANSPGAERGWAVVDPTIGSSSCCPCKPCKASEELPAALSTSTTPNGTGRLEPFDLVPLCRPRGLEHGSAWFESTNSQSSSGSTTAAIRR